MAPIDDASDAGLQREVGRLDGRLSAIEARMDRFESTVLSQLEGIQDKLNAISLAVATGGAKAAGHGDVVRWAVMLMAAASGWVFNVTHLFTGK